MALPIESLGTLLSVTAAPSLGVLGGIRTQRVEALVSRVGVLAQQVGPWVPPQWASRSTTSPPVTFLVSSSGQSTIYAFDGIIRAEHEQQTVITQNPVQTGAAINDHAYVVPPKLVVEIRMSDSMQSWMTGQWADSPSRSVSAYQTLISLMQPPTVIDAIYTRLRYYTNMMIAEVRAIEEHNTRFALRAMVTFQQVLTASVQILSGSQNIGQPDSILPQITDSSQMGQIQTSPISTNIFMQNNIHSLPAGTLSGVPSVAGSGNWSSYNVNQLPAIL